MTSEGSAEHSRTQPPAALPPGSAGSRLLPRGLKRQPEPRASEASRLTQTRRRHRPRGPRTAAGPGKDAGNVLPRVRPARHVINPANNHLEDSHVGRSSASWLCPERSRGAETREHVRTDGPRFEPSCLTLPGLSSSFSVTSYSCARGEGAPEPGRAWTL